MNNNKNYIKLKYTDYGYEIYVINGGQKKRLNKQDKIIMYNILKKFKYQNINDYTFIFPNYKLITLYFSKEKLNLNPKKINRRKSRQIISGILLLTTLVSATKAAENKINEIEDAQTSVVLELQTNEEKNDIDDINASSIIFNDDEQSEKIYEYIELTNQIETNNEIDSINTFYYECENPNDKEALINSQEYMEVYKKYEKIYGVDANLLCAIGAQECSGIHHPVSINGGYATGIMGIENIWSGEKIRVFNFEINDYEIIKVDYSKIGDLDYNIKIGAAIFQNYFYSTLRNNNSIEETDYLAFTLQKYNMGPGNMIKIMRYGSNWMDNRCMINAGDKYYIEHVLSRIDNDTVISIRLEDGNYYETKIVNSIIENKYIRN